jgi:hypothetical protein
MSKKDQKLLAARNRYIVDKINQSESIVSAVHEISTTLFISERTVYRVIKTTDTIIEKVNTGSQ